MYASSINAFEAACTALENHATKAQAEQELEQFALSPNALVVSREVAEKSTSINAQFHAIRIIRNAGIRLWTTLPAPERTGLRDWCLNFVLAQCKALARPVVEQLIVASAILWKRGWVEETPEERGKFLHNVSLLLAGDDVQAQLGSRLCLAMLQEFGATDSSSNRATAIGMPQEFHRSAAQKFAEHGLQECFVACSKLAMSRLSAAMTSSNFSLASGNPLCSEILTPLLECLSLCLGWDFRGTGRSAGSSLVRVSPGSLWTSILAESEGKILSTFLNLYRVLRQQPNMGGDSALFCRQILLLLCGLEGDVFPSQGRSYIHGFCVIKGLVEFLQPGKEWSEAPLVVMEQEKRNGRYVDESDYYNWMDTEGLELCQGIALALRTYKLQGLLSAHQACEHGSPLIITQPMTQQCVAMIYEVITSYILRALHPVYSLAMNLTSNVSRTHVAQATERIEDLLNSRYASIMALVDAGLEVWMELVLEMQLTVPSLQDSSAFGALTLSPARANFLQIFWDSYLNVALQLAADVFINCIRTRLAMAEAIMLCNINDDSPFEDASVLEEHLQMLAVIGRINTGACAQELKVLMSQTRQRFTFLLSQITSPSPIMDPSLANDKTFHIAKEFGQDVAFSVVNELFWWILSYIGAFLTDECEGEAPSIPAPINAYAHLASRKVVHVPNQRVSFLTPLKNQDSSPPSMATLLEENVTISLLHEVTVAYSIATKTLLVQGPGSFAVSPFLMQRYFWFFIRFVRAYLLLPPREEGGYDEPSQTIASVFYHAFSVAPESLLDPSLQLHASQVVPNAPHAVFPTLLQPLNVQADFLGGRSLLELLLQSSFINICVWLGNEADTTEAAINLLNTLSKNPNTSKFLTLSPSFVIFLEYFFNHAVMVTPDAPKAPEFFGISIPDNSLSGLSGTDSPNSVLAAISSHWYHTLPSVPGLTSPMLSSLVTIALSLVNSIGYTAPEAFTFLRELESDSDMWLRLQRNVTFSPEEKVPLEVIPLLQRWGIYVQQWTGKLCTSWSTIASSPLLASHTQDLRVVGAVERTVAQFIALIRANLQVPSDWLYPTLLFCLRDVPVLIDMYRSTGDVVTRSLEFIFQFVESHLPIPDKASETGLYTFIAASFTSFFKHHSNTLQLSQRATNKRSQESSSQRPSNSTSIASMMTSKKVPPTGGESNAKGSSHGISKMPEEDMYEDVLIVLRSLAMIAEKETISFTTEPQTPTGDLNGTGNNGRYSGILANSVLDVQPDLSTRLTGNCAAYQVMPSPEDVLLLGLVNVLPLLTESLLSYPHITNVFMSVVSHMLSTKPSHLIQMDPPLFLSLLQPIQYGLSHTDVEVIGIALDTIRGLGLFHLGAQRQGSQYQALSLQKHLAHSPNLFAQFSTLVLQFIMGNSVPPVRLYSNISDALLVCISCDPQGFQATVQAFLQEQAGFSIDRANRLIAEFTKLVQGVSFDAVSKGGPAWRAEKNKFQGLFKQFVENIRGIMTIL